MQEKKTEKVVDIKDWAHKNGSPKAFPLYIDGLSRAHEDLNRSTTVEAVREMDAQQHTCPLNPLNIAKNLVRFAVQNTVKRVPHLWAHKT